MDETIIIDAKHKLGYKAMNEFMSGQDPNTTVTMYIDSSEKIFERPIRNMRLFFEDQKVEEQVTSDDCVISFITDTRVLEIIGLDFTWWIAMVRGKKYRRLDKLFNAQEKKEKVESAGPETYKCACGIKRNSVVTDIEKFEGTQKDMIAFVNKIFAKIQIKSMFKANVVFCVNYKYDDDLNDANNWFTMHELCNKGVFKQ